MSESRTFHENPPLENGSYVWHYDIQKRNTRTESPNFFPGNFTSSWKLCLYEKTPRVIKVTFLSSDFDYEDDPMNFEFTISDNQYNLTLRENRNDYFIMYLPCTVLFSPSLGAEGKKISVKWNKEVFVHTEHLPQSLMTDFASLLANGKFIDVVIETKDSKIPAHQVVLAARSPVFCSMLENDTSEATTKRIKIIDFSTQTVQDIITYIYTSRLPKFNCDSVTELLKAADKYDLYELKEVCGEGLSRHLTTKNAMEMLLLADVYQEDFLKNKALVYIGRNLASFKDKEQFDPVKLRPDLLIQIIINTG